MPGGKEGSDSPSRKKSSGKGSDVFEHMIDLTRKEGWCGFSRGNEAKKESLSKPRKGYIMPNEGRENYIT